MRKTATRHLLSLWVAATLCSLSFAQTKQRVAAVMATGPIPCTCDLDNPASKAATKLSGFVDLYHSLPATDQTTTFILYDEQNLYVLFDCRDSHPDGIVGRETVRDSLFNQSTNNGALPNNEDYVEFSLDPFGTHQGGDIDIFAVNALGTRSAQLAGGRASKAEWSGDWQANVKRTPTGWIAQMTIPWKMIHYPSGGKVANVGLDALRFQYRTQVASLWANLGTNFLFEYEGVMTGVQLPKESFHRSLSVLPYILGGEVNGQSSTKIGVDSRYTLTPQLTAVGSFNPDFSTIENAVQTIQFAHATPFLQDFRPFFTEGGSNFNASISSVNSQNAFLYTPTIPTFNIGGKVYGKVTPNDSIGVLDTDSFLGRNDYAVREVHALGPTTSIGFMSVGTNQLGEENTVNEVDDHFRWGKFGVESIVANSEGAGAGGGAQLGSAYYVDQYITTALQVAEISSNFLTPDGYFPYTGYKGISYGQQYAPAWQHGLFRSANIGYTYQYQESLTNGPFWNGGGLSASVETRSDWHFEFDYQAQSALGTNDNTVGVNLIYGASNRFRQFGLQAFTGETGSVATTFFGPTASLRFLRKLDVLYNGAFQNRAGLTQQHIVTLNYQAVPDGFVWGRVIVQNADTNVYLFFHQSGGKGTEYYLIYGDPNALKTVNGIQAKVVFAING